MTKSCRAVGLAIVGLLAILAAGLPAPATAHENHLEEQADSAGHANGAAPAPAAMRQAMAEHRVAMEQAANADRPWPARLLNWLGRVHPFAVHFPIALIPISLLALLFARRRGEETEIIRALILVAGLSAVLAAALGWLDGGFLLADRNPVKLWHRWTGTGLGMAGAALALWAWRRRAAVAGRQMIAALGFLTLALLVQGWLGGAMVHGIRHLNW
jgi:uncharacterized membrane protein